MKDRFSQPPREALELSKSAYITSPIGAELFFAVEKDNNDMLRKARIESPLNNPTLFEQAESRRKLCSLCDQVFKRIVDVRLTIAEAFEAGLIDETTICELYDGVSDFIEQDDNNARLLLYLPFELVPDMTSRRLMDADVLQSSERFATMYRQSWIRLLFDIEVRASYVDGDILEPGLPDPEMVSKAGHLIPELLEKGILSVDDILNVIDIVEEPQITKSLAEGATVAQDKGLFTESAWENISQIVARKLPGTSLGPITYDEASFDSVTPDRTKWLRDCEEEAQESSDADKLADRIRQLGLSAIDLTAANSDTHYWKIALMGLFKTNMFAREVHPLFVRLLAEGNVIIRDTICDGLAKWTRDGIIDSEYANSLGITIPDLSSASQFEEDSIALEFAHLCSAVKKIQEDPLLARSLYPTFLVFGSRTKGYAKSNSDYDAAIFIKANVMTKDRDHVLAQLFEVAPEIRSVGSLREYWVGENEDRMHFRVIADNYRATDFRQIHFFLGGTWISHNNDYQKLRQDILEDYVDLSRFGDQKESVRSSLLAQLELDILQYRLMHKGFRRLYPSHKKQGSQHSHLIDWQSDFWDPGYRRVATKLFISRVFLPDLS